MKMEIRRLLTYLQHPEYREDPETSYSYRIKAITQLMIWALGIGVVLGLLMGILGQLGPWELDEHAFDQLLEEYPIPLIGFLLVVVAPVLEELIFRAPLWFFRGSRHFKIVCYGAAVSFGAVHLSNFPNISEIWFLAPLLISPQVVLGLFLGYIRVRFGLAWAMAFHGVYNGILAGPFLLMLAVKTPLQ